MGKFSDKLDKVFPVDDEKGRNERRAKWEENKKGGKDRFDFKKDKFKKHGRDDDDDGDDR